MTAKQLLTPSIVMALMSATFLLALGARRFAAVRARAVDVKYYKTFSDGAEPDWLRRHSRHVQNHFEVPPLFHLALFATWIAGQADGITLAIAWFFVGTRAVHSAIHLGYNHVAHRFFVFALGVLAVFALWARLLWSIL
jgi:hypothetical protein